jgi:hypothetical protein
MEQIEEQGKVLEGKYRKKQELSNKFNFDPGKKVDKLIDAIKKALNKKDKSDNGSGGGSRNKKGPSSKNDNSSDSESSGYSDDDTDDDKPSGKKKTSQN